VEAGARGRGGCCARSTGGSRLAAWRWMMWGGKHRTSVGCSWWKSVAIGACCPLPSPLACPSRGPRGGRVLEERGTWLDAGPPGRSRTGARSAKERPREAWGEGGTAHGGSSIDAAVSCARLAGWTVRICCVRPSARGLAGASAGPKHATAMPMRHGRLGCTGATARAVPLTPLHPRRLRAKIHAAVTTPCRTDTRCTVIYDT